MNNTYKLQSNEHRFIRLNELKRLYFQESKKFEESKYNWILQDIHKRNMNTINELINELLNAKVGDELHDYY